MRDALSILERCIQDGDNKIDEDKIKDLVGIPKISKWNRRYYISGEHYKKVEDEINDILYYNFLGLSEFWNKNYYK